MLIFISDLHLDDRTAGVQFLPASAFDHALPEIASQARKAGAKSIELVFLGDVFDLVRTTGWFRKPLEERPWGITDDLSPDVKAQREEALEKNAGELLEKLVAANRGTFDILGGSLKERYNFPVEPTRIYVPGNHDRICNQFESLRVRVTELLGLDRYAAAPRPANVRFLHYYHNEKYRAFARHGHEWDEWNIELSAPPPVANFDAYDWDSYMTVPIGELIATELASRMAPAVRKRLAAVLPDPAAQRALSDQFKTLDDVRPVVAIIPWLLDRLQTYQHKEMPPEVLQAILEGVADVLKYFSEIPFVHQWMRKHHTFNPFGPANLLQDILFLGQHIPTGIVKPLIPLAQRLSSFREADNLAHNAVSELHNLDSVPGHRDWFLYVLYGHTHQPAQIPIETTNEELPRVYLNTGTWRPVHQQGITGKGFISWKGLTYTLIYHPEDDPSSQANHRDRDCYPTFETWTGSLEEHPVVAEEVRDESDYRF